MTEMFNIMVAGEAMQVMPSKIQENVVPLRSHSKLRAYGQEKNIKLISVAGIAVVSVSFKIMLIHVELLRVNKLTSVFYASVLLLIMNFVITLSK